MKKVLFLCTGNYYRSRFSEGLFNFLAAREGLAWRADSRGLACGLLPSVATSLNVGPISPYTAEAFEKLGVPLEQPIRHPLIATEEDMQSSDKIVALKELEHRPMIRQYFSGWEDKVIYWHVHDVDQAAPELALAELETLVTGLVQTLASTP